MASAFLSRTLFNQNSQKLSSLLFKKPLQAWASSTPTAQRRFTLVCSDMASTMRGSTACFSTQSVSTGEPDLKVEKNIEDQTHQHIDAGSKVGDAGHTEASAMTPKELYATVLPKLQEKGFFDVSINVESSLATFGVKTSLEATVHSFKSVLERKFDIPIGQQCLICEGNILEDDQTLKSYGLAAGHTLYLIVLGGPTQNQTVKPRYAETARTAETAFNAGASIAQVIQGMYDSDPLFRQMMKSPALFRQFCSPSPKTRQEMMTIHQSLLSGLSQQQTTGNARQTGGATGTAGAGDVDSEEL
ncbi:uncharacterized protein [Rutidosis leptorrhynchoides]|uniref:uncharacterized protein n=1 Tax=Rutidosis leptorrhynchoides TaxID=125765 RepID=UPI003A99248A